MKVAAVFWVVVVMFLWGAVTAPGARGDESVVELPMLEPLPACEWELQPVDVEPWYVCPDVRMDDPAVPGEVLYPAYTVEATPATQPVSPVLAETGPSGLGFGWVLGVCALVSGVVMFGFSRRRSGGDL
jgi:hypothetical protein